MFYLDGHDLGVPKRQNCWASDEKKKIRYTNKTNLILNVQSVCNRLWDIYIFFSRTVTKEIGMCVFCPVLVTILFQSGSYYWILSCNSFLTGVFEGLLILFRRLSAGQLGSGIFLVLCFTYWFGFFALWYFVPVLASGFLLLCSLGLLIFCNYKFQVSCF